MYDVNPSCLFDIIENKKMYLVSYQIKTFHSVRDVLEVLPSALKHV